MIRLKKTVSILCILTFVVLALSACRYFYASYEWKVCGQANTTWVSDDESIVFHVNDNHHATGTINVNGEIIDIYVTEGPLRGREMHVYPINVLEDEVISESDKYEWWICSYKSKKKFVATVEKSTFHETGQKITFRRVDDSEAQ